MGNGAGRSSPWVPRDGCVSILEEIGKGLLKKTFQLGLLKAGVCSDHHNIVLSGKEGTNAAER